eukprot:1148902-Pelagomonas_calceolata.AAC.6
MAVLSRPAKGYDSVQLGPTRSRRHMDPGSSLAAAAATATTRGAGRVLPCKTGRLLGLVHAPFTNCPRNLAFYCRVGQFRSGPPNAHNGIGVGVCVGVCACVGGWVCVGGVWCTHARACTTSLLPECQRGLTEQMS